MTIMTKNGYADRVPKGAVVMLGYFDGFHRGHTALCDAANEIRQRKNGSSVILWTFAHLAKGKAITDNREKAEAFFSYTPEEASPAVVFEDFSAVSHLTGEEFVREVLKKQLDASAVVCGFNFRFGKNASCGAEELERYCGAEGMECCVVSPVSMDSETVSSTVLRRLIEAGAVDEAAERMGRYYSVTAPVVHGKRLGHKLGFPTINQRIPPEKVTPAFGVYACRVSLTDETGETVMKNGVCNLGFRPTVNGDASDITLETYLFDYDGDLYGETVTVYFCKHLRGEMRFSSVDELSRQIAIDRASAADYFERG